MAKSARTMTGTVALFRNTASETRGRTRTARRAASASDAATTATAAPATASMRSHSPTCSIQSQKQPTHQQIHAAAALARRTGSRFPRPAMGKLACVRDGDALVLVDVLADFGHPDGEALFAAFREAVPSLQAAIASARAAGVPVVYANDDFGTW